MRTIAIALGFAAAAGLAGLPASAGELSGVAVSGNASWSPTACVRPISPLGLGYDANSLNIVVSEYNRYADAAQAYMTCVSRESLEDRRTVQQVIESSERRINGDMMAEVERARARLTSGNISIR